MYYVPTACVALKAVNIYIFLSRIVINIECLCCDKPPALAVDNFTFIFLTAILDDAPLNFAAAGVDVITLNPPTDAPCHKVGDSAFSENQKHCGRLPRGVRLIQSHAG